MYPDEHQSVRSLQDLVKRSDLIIEGTVQLVLQPVNRNRALPHDIQTDFLIDVQAAFKGAIPDDARTIVLAQPGGKAGSYEMVVPDDPLLKTGEHYILFLNPDKRKEPANTTGRPRYYVVGIWAGKVKIESGKVHFLPRAKERFKEYDGADLDAFLAVVKGRINHTIIPPMRNGPPHPFGKGVVTVGKPRDEVPPDQWPTGVR